MRLILSMALTLALAAPAFAQHCYRRPVYYSQPVVHAKPVTNTVERVFEKAVPTDQSVNYSYTYNISYSQLPAQQGATLYGYPTGSYSSVADIYSNVDLGALYDQAIRLTADSQAYSAKALAGATSLIDAAGEQRARVAEILAKGQATAEIARASAEIAKATSAANSVHVRRSYDSGVSAQAQAQASVGPAGGSAVDYTGASSTELRGRLEHIFRNRCVGCHGADGRGGLDLRDISQLSAEDADNIIDRIRHPDPTLRMPLAADGSPGEPLPLEELKVIVAASVAD